MPIVISSCLQPINQSHICRYHTGGGEHKETAGKLMHSLANVRTITAHFGPKGAFTYDVHIERQGVGF